MPLSQIKTNSIAAGNITTALIASGNITSALIASVANTAIVGRIATAQQPTGAVLQTVANTTITSSTSSNAVILTLSITPSSASSRILLLGNIEGERLATSSTGNYIFGQLRKNGSNIRQFMNAAGYQQTTGARNFNTVAYIDSPATTSSLTYDIWIDHSTQGSSSGVGWNWYTGSFFALEIAS